MGPMARLHTRVSAGARTAVAAAFAVTVAASPYLTTVFDDPLAEVSRSVFVRSSSVLGGPIYGSVRSEGAPHTVDESALPYAFTMNVDVDSGNVEQLSSPILSRAPIRIVAFADESTGLLIQQNSVNKAGTEPETAVYKTLDAGATWQISTTIKPVLVQDNDMMNDLIWFSPSMAMACGAQMCLSTDNAGDSWVFSIMPALAHDRVLPGQSMGAVHIGRLLEWGTHHARMFTITTELEEALAYQEILVDVGAGSRVSIRNQQRAYCGDGVTASAVSWVFMADDFNQGLYHCVSAGGLDVPYIYSSVNGGGTWQRRDDIPKDVRWLKPTCAASMCYMVGQRLSVPGNLEVYKISMDTRRGPQRHATHSVRWGVNLGGNHTRDVVCLTDTMCFIAGFEGESHAPTATLLLATTDGWATVHEVPIWPSALAQAIFTDLSLSMRVMDREINNLMIGGARGQLLELNASAFHENRTQEIVRVYPHATDRNARVAAAIWSRGQGVELTEHAVFRTNDFGASWTPDEKALLLLREENVRLDAAAFFSPARWLLATSRLVVENGVAGVKAPAIYWTPDAGATVHHVCYPRSPAKGHESPVRQVAISYARNSARAMDASIYIVHPFTLYKWDPKVEIPVSRANVMAPDAPCGTIVRQLPYPVPATEGRALSSAEHMIAIGCSPAKEGRCLLLTLQVTFADTMENGALSVGPSSKHRHRLGLRAGCGSGPDGMDFLTTVDLPRTVQPLQGVGGWGKSEVLFGSIYNVLVYTGAVRNALMTSMNGGFTWRHHRLNAHPFNLSSTASVASAAFMNATTAVVAVWDSAPGSVLTPRLFMLEWAGGDMVIDSVELSQLPGVELSMSSLNPGLVSVSPPFYPDYDEVKTTPSFDVVCPIVAPASSAYLYMLFGLGVLGFFIACAVGGHFLYRRHVAEPHNAKLAAIHAVHPPVVHVHQETVSESAIDVVVENELRSAMVTSMSDAPSSPLLAELPVARVLDVEAEPTPAPAPVFSAPPPPEPITQLPAAVVEEEDDGAGEVRSVLSGSCVRRTRKHAGQILTGFPMSPSVYILVRGPGETTYGPMPFDMPLDFTGMPDGEYHVSALLALGTGAEKHVATLDALTATMERLDSHGVLGVDESILIAHLRSFDVRVADGKPSKTFIDVDASVVQLTFRHRDEPFAAADVTAEVALGNHGLDAISAAGAAAAPAEPSTHTTYKVKAQLDQDGIMQLVVPTCTISVRASKGDVSCGSSCTVPARAELLEEPNEEDAVGIVSSTVLHDSSQVLDVGSVLRPQRRALIMGDRSGSMNKGGKITMLRNTCQQLYDHASKIGASVAIAIWAYNVEFCSGRPRYLAAEDMEMVGHWIANMQARGGTKLYLCVKSALSDMPPVDDCFIICDGDLDAEDIAKWPNLCAMYPKVKFHFVALGEDAKVDTMAALAAMGGGTFTATNTK